MTLHGHGGAGLVLGGAHQRGHVANHGGVTNLVTSGLGQLSPDLEPVRVVLVDTLTTDLDLYGGDQGVAEPVHPAESGVVGHGHIGQDHLEVSAVDQITVTGDRAGHFFAPICLAVNSFLTSLQKISKKEDYILSDI